MINKYITAFGETKNIKSWSEDKRCVVPIQALYKRFSNSWNPEEAITSISKLKNPTHLEGKRFGRLIVLNFTGEQSKRKERMWLCKCDCGQEKIFKTSALVSGNISSCGCYRKEVSTERLKQFYLGYGVAVRNALFSIYFRAAKLRGLEWELTKEEFELLSQQNCFYCGAEPSKVFQKKTDSSDIIIYNGVDRYDNNLGYVSSNCVSCCQQCNIMKFDYTKDEFFDKVEKIYKKHIEKS